MIIRVDTVARVVHIDEGGATRSVPFASPEAFRLVSDAWLQVGWDVKHVYTFTWLGRPIIQLPEDLLRLQEVIVRVRPTVIVETGIAHGGSLLFHASLLLALGTGTSAAGAASSGRVIGVDREIRPHNRAALEAHALAHMLTLIEGSSVHDDVVSQVRSHIRPDDRVMVILDSNHTRAHVLAELEHYTPMVSPGSYIVACDGIMKDLVGAPRAAADWATNNPYAAAREFAASHPEVILEAPAFAFDESTGPLAPVTYWPGAWLRKR